jgi:PiT family inorganic phosphate transporter
MSLALAFGIVASGLYVGANIGANDAANCIGASVGAGLVRYRTGIVLVAVFAAAGALFQGSGVAKTVGKGIVTDPLSVQAVLSALLCGGLFVSIATFLRIPVSTSQSVVGAVAGVGMAGRMNMDWSQLLNIVGSWVLCPILSMVLTYLLYRITLRAIDWGGDTQRARRVMRWLVLASAAYAAYSLGANNLGNAIGPIAALETEIVQPPILVVLGALSISLGALLFGRGVCETVGQSIVPLELTSSFAVQVSAGFGLHLFSTVGVPVSTSQAVVGALMGIGLYHGVRAVSMRKMAEVTVGWVVTPTCAGLVAFVIYRVADGLVGG